MEISVSELEQVRNDYAELGRKLENDRIIKLLELWQSDDDESGITYKELIALIKGENK